MRVTGGDLGDLDVSIRGDRRDAESGILESDQVGEMTRVVREATAAHFRAGRRLLVLGGCCAVVPGILAGARDSGAEPGIVLVDGHLDLYDGHNSPLGEAADMPLSVALGVGPSSWVEACGGPSLTPERTWIVGYRDGEEARDAGSIMPEDFAPELGHMTTDDLRRAGSESSALAILGTLDNFWVHLDLDVVDPELFFANDAPVPGGLNWDELVELLQPLLNAPSNLGISVCCYNPEKDPTGRNADEIVDLISRATG